VVRAKIFLHFLSLARLAGFEPPILRLSVEYFANVLLGHNKRESKVTRSRRDISMGMFLTVNEIEDSIHRYLI
jgi:hypothetical protein